jgi:hypothetical protein
MRLDKLIDALRDPNEFLFHEIKMTLTERNSFLSYLGLYGVARHGPPQLFDFGLVPDKQIGREAKVILEPLYEGFVRLPAPVCVFKRDWLGSKEYGSNHFLQALTDEENVSNFHSFLRGDGRNKFSTYTLVYELYKATGTEEKITYEDHERAFQGISYHDFCIHHNTGEWLWDGTGYEIDVMGQDAQLEWHHKKRISYKGQNGLEADLFTDEHFNQNAVRTSRHMLACLSRLNGLGVGRETYVAPPKLNKSRIKKGKTPLSDYTKVRIAPYRAPLGHSGPHDEVSRKRFHFRRGHIRHFQNGEKTWVRHALVGNREDGEVTHEYEVRT